MSKTLWSTGIIVHCRDNKWNASCKWQGGELLKDGHMEGEIYTRYHEASLEGAINNVLELMKRFGIKKCNELEGMQDEILNFTLYYKNDNYEEMTQEQFNMFKTEAEKRMWRTYISD